MRFENAIARRPGANFADGITSASLGTPSFEKAYEQHAAYCDALHGAGVMVTVLEAEPRFPDGEFVEDTAVLVGRRAVLTRPGAGSRLGEAAAMREHLERFVDAIDEIEAPGRLDGGDVCEAGNHFYVGLSHRTNIEGATQLAALLAKAGKTSMIVDIREMRGILHLKSGMSYLGDGRFVAIDELLAKVDVPAPSIVRVRAGEEYAANCVRVNGVVLMPAGHPYLEEALSRAGFSPVALDVSEYRKMDGGLSCLSLRL